MACAGIHTAEGPLSAAGGFLEARALPMSRPARRRHRRLMARAAAMPRLAAVFAAAPAYRKRRGQSPENLRESFGVKGEEPFVVIS